MISNNLCFVSLFLAYAVVLIFFSNSYDTFQTFIPAGAEGLPTNSGNHVYPYLASFFTCMCCTGIVMIIVCYNNIMASIGGAAADYTRMLRFEE